jgi:hypothetical protein
VGLATHNPRGQVRFGVTAAAASAVLYGALVLLGVNAASSSDVGGDGDRDTSVVLIRPHDTAAPGPAQRLPQASPGSARHQGTAKTRPHATVGVGSPATKPRPASTPAQPGAASAPPEAKSDPRSQPSTPKQSTEQKPILEVTPPKLPPPLPDVPLPTVTVPSLPVPLPSPPALPPTPSLPGVSDLPG